MRAVDQVIEALRDRGGAASSWLVGEPCFDPPVELRDALARASRADTFCYSPPAGLPRLREILADRHGEAGCRTAPDEVVITNGAKGGLLAVLASLLEPGDELIHPLPCYPAYPAMTKRLGGLPVPVAEGNGTFDGWLEAVSDALGPRTRAVVLSSPSNPTGATLTEDQARTLVELCRDHDVRLLCDEAYIDFRYHGGAGRLPAHFDPERTTVIQVRSASKSWALCGWRLGWVVADSAFAARVAAQHAALLNPASGPAQEAFAMLPLVGADYLSRARAAVRSRIADLGAALAERFEIVHQPAGGFYLWLDVGANIGADSTAALCSTVARRHGVGLWPGEDFGGAGHVRLAVTAPPAAEWEAAVGALVSALSSTSAHDGV